MLAPKDHWPLVKELKKLSLQEAIRLLRYCQSLYKMHGVAANVQLLKPHKGSRTPYLRCVVEWITALLDAHFAALVLAPECHALLKVSLSLARALSPLACSHTLSLLSRSLALSLSLLARARVLSLSLARACSLISHPLFSLSLSRSHTVSPLSRSLFSLSCSLSLSLSLLSRAHTHRISRTSQRQKQPWRRKPSASMGSSYTSCTKSRFLSSRCATTPSRISTFQRSSMLVRGTWLVSETMPSMVIYQ
jgi:hypothetical protein